MNRWIVLAGMAALLAALSGCAAPAVTAQADGGRWDGGVWNSVLGYHGPTNVLVSGPR